MEEKSAANYTYMLLCSDNSLYTGWTNNLKTRIDAHNKGTASKYTRSRLPVRLAYHEVYATKEEAMRREREIKALTRIQKIKLCELKQEDLKKQEKPPACQAE